MPPVKKSRGAKGKSAAGRGKRRAASKPAPRVDVAALMGGLGARLSLATKIIYGVAAAAAALALLVAWAGGYLGAAADGFTRMVDKSARGAGLEVRRVALIGRARADGGDLLDAVGPVMGAPILGVDLQRMRQRVEALGWVRAATVRRVLPSTLQITIVERAPSAVWQNKGVLTLVDDDGFVIRPISAYEYSNLPLIVGAGAPDAAAEILPALAAHPEIKKRIAALIRVSMRRWDMKLRNGAEIKLPEDGVPHALALLSGLQAAGGLLDQPIEYVNLLDPEHLVVRRRDEAAPDATSPAIGAAGETDHDTDHHDADD